MQGTITTIHIYFKFYYSKHSQLSEVAMSQSRADLQNEEGSIPRTPAQMSIEEAACLRLMIPHTYRCPRFNVVLEWSYETREL